MRKKQRKTKYAVAVALLAAIMLFCTGCGCTGCSEKSRTNNIRLVKTETESVYSFVTSDGITIGGKYYPFEDLACSTAGYPKPDTGYPHWYDYREDKTLFLYQLKIEKKGPEENAAGKYQNNSLFDLGLFGVDNKTGDCTMLALYKGVYPTYKFRGTYEPIVYGVDNNYVILFYNGRVEVLDINSRETVYSRQFFAEDAFKNHEGELPNPKEQLPYNFTDGNDLVIYDNGVMKLYRYSNGAYAATPLEFAYDVDFVGTNNIGNIIFIYYYKGYDGEYDSKHSLDKSEFWRSFEKDSLEYVRIYDLENKCEVSEEDLSARLKEEKTRRNKVYEPKLNVGGDTFSYEDDPVNGTFTITRERDGKSVALNCQYFEDRSPAYVRLIKEWNPGDTVYASPLAAYAVADKLLVCCRGSTPAIYLSMKTPRYYFELDFDSGDVFYAGFSEHGYYEAEMIVKH